MLDGAHVAAAALSLALIPPALLISSHAHNTTYPPPTLSPSHCSVSAYVPNETAKATLQVERNDYLVNKHFNGWLDTDEKKKE